MPWLQFFDEEDNLLREYEASRMAKIMMDQGGTIILDEAAQDSPTNPRVLMVRGHYAYAKSISDSERDKLLGSSASEGKSGGKASEAGGAPIPMPEIIVEDETEEQM